MSIIPQFLFVLILGFTTYLGYRNIRRISSNIKLGKPTDRSGNRKERLKNVALIAFGQKKMFKRPLPAILHLFVYLGFLIVNIEILEIVIDGILGTHRVFAPYLGKAYPYLIGIFEFFAVTVLVSCTIFLIRRNIVHVSRFKGIEMKAWPKLDANIILAVEILLMIALLSMNATDAVLQSHGVDFYPQTGSFFFSGMLMPIFSSLSPSTLIIIERSTWWIHILGVLAFGIYVLSDSKHLHIFMAFPNTFYAKLRPQGYWNSLPSVTREVNLMLNLPQSIDSNELLSDAENERFGAKDVTDLTWKNLMDAYTCTECGRCTSNCPANITGKKLSPRKIMMDTRDRLEEVGKNSREKGPDYDDGKSLLGDYISTEELMACTTCSACVEACPVLIDPLDIIVQLRRYKIMEEAQAPASWNDMFSNIENNFAPWKFSPSDRYNWSEKLNS
jgi:heterodisulfide reductase subunit C